MTILDVYKAVVKRIILVAIITAAAGLAVGIYSWALMDDVYKASATIIVSSQKGKDDSSAAMTYNDYTLNIKLVNSYQVLCKTDRVLSQVIKETGIPLKVDQLSNKITVEAQKDTEIISISVEDKDPEIARKISNSLADVFQREVISIMKMDNVQVIDYAELPDAPVWPNRMQNLVLALLVGFALGVGVALLIDYLDTTVKSTEQVEELLGVPVLGVIPHISQNGSR